MPWSFKKSENQRRLTFGLEYLCAQGYDNKRALIHNGGNVNVTTFIIEKEIKVSVGIMENFLDYQGLCNALQLTKTEMIRLFGNRLSRLEDILKFLYKILTTRMIVCSIYIATENASLINQSKNNNLKQISKIALGHHVIICIPVNAKLPKIDEIEEEIMKVINGKEREENVVERIPEYLLKDATALVNYKHVYEKNAVDLLKGLSNINFPVPVSLFVDLSARESINKFNRTPAKNTLAVIFKLKRFLYLAKSKRFNAREIKGPNQILTEAEKNMIIKEINENVKILEAANKECFPPLITSSLYQNCKEYENYFLLEIYLRNLLPTIYITPENSLEEAFTALNSTHYVRINDLWFIEMNDNNADFIKQNILKGKKYIFVNNNSIHLASYIYSERITWVFSRETQWNKAEQPVLWYYEKEDILMGLATTSPCCRSKSVDHLDGLYVGVCECDCNKSKKAWLCLNCKLLLHFTTTGRVICECGTYSTKDISKICFDCQGFSNNTLTDKYIDNISESDQKSDKAITSVTTNVEVQDVKILHDEWDKKKTFNILFVGKTGAGKSMLVNSIYDYLMYDFDTAAKEEIMTCFLPLKFQLQTPDYTNVVFEAGPSDENENSNDKGQSVTQKPKIYALDASKYNLNIIDTPGLGDTRGAEQDQINLELIHEKLTDVENLNAICFVMPSNISKLTANFEMIMRDLLSLFPKSALKNVFFIFTHANSSFFTIGDTREPVDAFIAKFKETNEAEIPFGPNNVCCVDSEAFMYFIATKQGYNYHNRDHESFRFSWDESKKSIEKLLQHLEEMEPVDTIEICMNYELQKIATDLTKQNEERLKELIPPILTQITKISLTSKFNSNRDHENNVPDQMLSKIFEGLFLCSKYVNDKLKQRIECFINKYGDPYKEQLEILNAKLSPPTPIKPVENNNKAPANENEEENRKTFVDKLKNVAENLAILWDIEGIPSYLIKAYAQIQTALTLKYESLQNEKLKEALKEFAEESTINVEIKNDINNILNY